MDSRAVITHLPQVMMKACDVITDQSPIMSMLSDDEEAL
jgi:hypothetical protein